MSNFHEDDKLGRMGERVVELGLRQAYTRVVVTPKNITDQLANADLVCRGFPKMGIPDKKVEVKTERTFTGNLFWETWSNKRMGREGWGLTSPADELYYLFWEEARGFRIKRLDVCIWLFNYTRDNFREVEQKRSEQANDTWGALVPIITDWLKPIEFSFAKAKSQIESCKA